VIQGSAISAVNLVSVRALTEKASRLVRSETGSSSDAEYQDGCQEAEHRQQPGCRGARLADGQRAGHDQDRYRRDRGDRLRQPPRATGRAGMSHQGPGAAAALARWRTWAR